MQRVPETVGHSSRVGGHGGNADRGYDLVQHPDSGQHESGRGGWELWGWPFQPRVSTLATAPAAAVELEENSPPAAALDVVLEPEDNAPGEQKQKPAGWNFEEGTAIAEGRTVLKHLGGGSQYEVYLVWDDRLCALMVAKILRPDRVEHERSRRDFQREAAVLEQLAHPVLLRGFGAVHEGPYPHLLLEYIEGPTLRRLIKRHGALPLEHFLPLTLHIAAALHYLSAECTVHLDIKPSNIVMGVLPRLLDLSIARSFDSAAQLRQAIGTDAYMPPEQCDPTAWPGRIGPAADIWGLGATLYHATTGHVPFPRPRDAADSDEPTQRFPQLVTAPRPFPKHIPLPLQELILGMLAPEPAERPAAAEVTTALEPLIVPLPQKLKVTRRGIRAVTPRAAVPPTEPAPLPTPAPAPLRGRILRRLTRIPACRPAVRAGAGALALLGAALRPAVREVAGVHELLLAALRPVVREVGGRSGC